MGWFVVDHAYAPLIRTLAAAGKPAHCITSKEGGALVALPYGGRILGLYFPTGPDNGLWTHPALASSETAQRFYAGSEWHNSGGMRTWIAPETHLFYPRYPDLSEYQQPAPLEAESHDGEWGDGEGRFTHRFQLRSYAAGRDIQMRLMKQVRMIENPLPAESWRMLSDTAEYTGFSVASTLEVQADPLNPEMIGLWNLLQVPHAGRFIIPMRQSAEPRDYFGTVPPDDLTVTDRRVTYRSHAVGVGKIGLPARSVTGRMGYVWHSSGQAFLLVVEFPVDPSGTYVDKPPGSDAGEGDAVQLCSVQGEWGAFSEVEHHSPGLSCTVGGAIQHNSRVWAFRGMAAAIQTITNLLLPP